MMFVTPSTEPSHRRTGGLTSLESSFCRLRSATRSISWGEVKKFQATTAVQPKHVSRLVARLGRGQYGLFVTTSYYTKQTQEEVLADAQGPWSIAGADVVNMMRQLRIARGPSISPTWLEAVAEEMRIGLFNRN